MITRITARRFRCLKAVDQSLGHLEILVGPNGSGKSAFLDVLAFLATSHSEGLDTAIHERTENFHDLVWGRQGNGFELAIEAEVPADRRRGRAGNEDSVRYEVEVRIDPEQDVFLFAKERVTVRRSGFGRAEILVIDRAGTSVKLYDPELDAHGPSIGSPRNLSALHSVGTDREKFPAIVWLSELLAEGIQWVELESGKLRAPSPPHRGTMRKLDGSNLARQVAQLEDKHPRLFRDWVAHLRTSLPELKTVRSELRPEDRRRYLILQYQNGARVPSWVVSDGTLRMMALTLLAYLPDFRGVYLVEEPENGIHPKAIETVYQSLSSVYQGQVLLASHSPTLLGLGRLDQLLCFIKTPEGVEIVRGDEHSLLQGWKGDVSLSDLFAAGVLG